MNILRNGHFKAALLTGALALSSALRADVALLNVSYDPTRELYEEYNKAFEAHWLKETGETVTVNQSHGGSGAQARAVIDGLQADVVTLALSADIDAIADKAELLPQDWETKLPDHSTPYTSTIVFLVRKGNPKHVKDWDDLIRTGVSVIPANPKTSGGARWTYLAAWGAALKRHHGDEAAARAYVTAFYQHAPVLDAGARGATTTFVERGIGDVLVGWENEAYLAKRQAPGEFEVVVPSASILAEPPVAVVEKNAERHGTTEVAQAYLKYLYSHEGQEIAAKYFYRPRDPKVLAEHSREFAKVKLFTIEKLFGGWKKAQAAHFADGGIFDQIYAPASR
ncbi:MAG TPA: sulfate ABC transporter substrate-binding protein [bacterium]|jgi:sulfate/thiosulfate-binding protein|nr:sulfate ABC transporter substrate-binding protein [bacterium]